MRLVPRSSEVVCHRVLSRGATSVNDFGYPSTRAYPTPAQTTGIGLKKRLSLQGTCCVHTIGISLGSSDFRLDRMHVVASGFTTLRVRYAGPGSGARFLGGQDLTCDAYSWHRGQEQGVYCWWQTVQDHSATGWYLGFCWGTGRRKLSRLLSMLAIRASRISLYAQPS